MDVMLLRLFQQQVLLNCHFVLIAADDLQQSSSDTTRTFFALHNLVSAGANIAKALWGAGRDADAIRQMREPLRTSLGITDDSPLRAVRLRNRFEHFDEYLDDWWARSPSHGYVDLNLGDVRQAVSGISVDAVFRNYDPATGLATFLDEDFDIGAIVAEVRSVLPVVLREASRPPWE